MSELELIASLMSDVTSLAIAVFAWQSAEKRASLLLEKLLMISEAHSVKSEEGD